MNLAFATLIAVALQLPPPWYGPGEINPETPEQYRARVTVIVQAAEAEAKLFKPWPWGPRALATMAVIHAYGESSFRLNVHDGTKLGDNGQSRCLGQVKASGRLSDKDWLATSGTSLESTRNCMRAMMRYLSIYRHRCARGLSFSELSVTLTLSGYGTGGRCYGSKNAPSRARKIMTAYWSSAK